MSASLALLLDGALLALALALALWCIGAADTLRATMVFVAFGLVLTLLWVRLEAVDVALTEAAVGSGVTGLLLMRAAARLPAPGSSSAPISSNPSRPGRALRLAAAAVALLIAGALAAAVLSLPVPAPTLAPDAARYLPLTQLGNPVTGVLLVYRALDTLLETVVLLLVLVGVWSLAPDRFWGGAPAPLWRTPPVGPLVFLARVLPPFGLLMGLHLFWTGADHPGGAFQGGALLAAMWLLVLLAGLGREPVSRAWPVRLLVVAGPGLFIAAGFLGSVLGGGFLSYPPGWEKPVIIAIEAALTFSIAVTLGLLVLGPPQRAPAT
ncbi:MAG: sodium:proton antiporter [Rhizobiales bacterium 32-66-8]|nr:MAG: sodium:proton antiporter [Rhizobiales bacterium 32-66-8]